MADILDEIIQQQELERQAFSERQHDGRMGMERAQEALRLAAEIEAGIIEIGRLEPDPEGRFAGTWNFASADEINLIVSALHLLAKAEDPS